MHNDLYNIFLKLITMKVFRFIPLIIMIFCLSCQYNKDEQNSEFSINSKNEQDIVEFENMTCSDDPENSIIGEWKLVKTQVNHSVIGSYIIDNSQDNIIYEFQKDGTLIISGNIDDAEFDKGEYAYKFETRTEGESGLNLMIYFTGSVYGTRYPYCISKNLMIFNFSTLDGDTMYFKKLTK